VCVASFSLGVFIEMMMVQWTVTMARNIPPDKLARVSSYDVLGSVMAMPAGALIAGPLAAAIGISHAQYAAAAAIVLVSALALIPRDVRAMRSNGPAQAGTEAPGHAVTQPVVLGSVVPGVPQAEILGDDLEAARRLGPAV
jgi:hypothetical protein